MPTASLLDGLNADQRAAARTTQGPLCIIAGAGTGKTRTITHRIACQVAEGVASPDQILAVTFTDKAAGELRQRLAGMGLSRPVRAATFHAAAWAQLRWFWHRAYDTPLPEVLASKVRLLVPLARRTSTQAMDLATEIEWAKARRLPPDDYAVAAAGRDAPLEPERMAGVYADYERAKDEAGLLDYEDMLLRAAALIQEHPDIAAEVRDRYRFFTVDEFQDVNPAQFALLRAWLGPSQQVCVVGDDDQTIYSFTGATADYLLEFRRWFPTAATVTLTENYRSTPQVLALANAVLWNKRAGQRKRLSATRAGGPAPVFGEHTDDEAEREAVVAAIRGLVEEEIPPGEIAVAYRVNSQSEGWEQALRGAGIPYAVRGAGGFYQRREVRQALTVLRAAASRPEPVPPGLEQTTPARPVRADKAVSRALREQMGWDGRAEPEGEAARERWRNLGALVEVAAGLADDDATTTLADVVTELSRREAEGADAPGPGGAVTLLTLHKTKGLEFSAVFLVALEEGLLPISHAKTDEAVQEERRLLYVGITRARRQLSLSWAQRRPGYGGKVVARRPSRFLYNLGEGAPVSGSQQAATRLRTRTPSPLDGAENPALVQRLRDWRRERAKADDVPAFVVFNDRTLVALAAQRPSTPRALLAVSGVGPAKVKRYGEDLIRVIAQTPS
jgi:DNA helicase-2/ATP-dependent DNA helicase PcrA